MLVRSFEKPRPSSIRVIAAIFATVCLASTGSLAQQAPSVDLNGDGLSDVWQLAFDAGDLDPAEDDDGDGATNGDECRLGTDPRDPGSRFAFLGFDSSQQATVFRFLAAAQQTYGVEVSENLMDWSPDGPSITSEGGEDALVIPHTQDIVFMRFKVGGDADHDGISDFEENLLGFARDNPNSDPSFLGGDMVKLVTMLTSGESFTVKGEPRSGRLPTLAESSRFLHQATLGVAMADIESLSTTGYAAWLDGQFAEEPGLTEPEIDARIAAEQDTFLQHRRYAWWNQVLQSDDLLRQRLAVALSEIYVISDQVNDFPEGLANYYDMLLRNAFGDWRDLIEDVTMHPMMGYYLSHLMNRKAEPSENRFPDENFAREIMQLFSIGLFELNPDGSRKKDTNGEDIPTYDNDDITQFARVFTGFSWGGTDDDGNPKDTTVWWQFFWSRWDADDPMMIWPNEHDMEAKTLLRGTKLPAFADDPGRVPMDDVDDALDTLFNHPNTGPFLAFRLIQRLVTSNPSPEYIRRVSQVFADNGQGVRGDLKAVVKAILLDVEARRAPDLQSASSGRLREPYLRWVRLVRSLGARSEDGTNIISDWNAMDDLEQSVLSSRTVFNFFQPDYQPAGEMSAAGLYGPEFQILTDTTAMATQNYFGYAIMWGFGGGQEEDSRLRFPLTDEIALIAAGDLETVIDRWDILLTCGVMSENTKDALRAAYEGVPSWYGATRTTHALLRLVIMSPDFAIYR